MSGYTILPIILSHPKKDESQIGLAQLIKDCFQNVAFLWEIKKPKVLTFGISFSAFYAVRLR
jgi:hypothetical protein